MLARRAVSLMIGSCIGIGVVVLGLATYVVISEADDTSNTKAPAVVSITTSQGDEESYVIQSARELENLLSPLSLGNRDITLRTLLADFNNQQVRHLLQVSEEIQPTELRDEVQSVLIQKYSLVDPEDALSQVANLDEYRRHRLISVVFEVWSSTDLDRAVDFAHTLDSMSRRAAVIGIANSKRSLSRDRFISIAMRLGHEQIAHDQIAQSKIDVPIDSPESEWNSFLTHYGSSVGSMSEIQHQLLVHILNSWVQIEGSGVVPMAMASMDDYESRISTLDKLVPKLAESHPYHARSIVTRMLEVDRGMVMESIGNWATSDPQGTLEFTFTLEDEETRNRMQQVAIEYWSQSNPMDLLDSLAMIPIDLKEWSQQIAIYALANSFPAQAAKEISDMRDGPQKDSALLIIVRNWFESDPSAVTEWAKTDPKLSILVENLVYSQVMDIARTDPETALNMALQHEVDDETGIGYEASVIRQVASYDVDKAISLLRFARNEQTQGEAYSRIGQVLIQNDEPERAIQLVEEVSPEVQSQYYRWISVFWIRKNSIEVFEAIDNLPSGEIRALYADLLLLENSRNSFLSSEQAGDLRTFLLQEADNGT